jgi:hypothetical protein
MPVEKDAGYRENWPATGYLADSAMPEFFRDPKLRFRDYHFFGNDVLIELLACQ